MSLLRGIQLVRLEQFSITDLQFFIMLPWESSNFHNFWSNSFCCGHMLFPHFCVYCTNYAVCKNVFCIFSIVNCLLFLYCLLFPLPSSNMTTVKSLERALSSSSRIKFNNGLFAVEISLHWIGCTCDYIRCLKVKRFTHTIFTITKWLLAIFVST